MTAGTTFASFKRISKLEVVNEINSLDGADSCVAYFLTEKLLTPIVLAFLLFR